MLSKFLGKTSYRKMKTDVSKMNFLGDLTGNGVNALRIETGKLLKQFSHIQNAYFSALKYEGEEKNRICLVIELTTSLSQKDSEIVNLCADIAPMDIMFSESLPPSTLHKIRSESSPLFDESNLLFECPIIVSRGSSTEMPVEWKGAILNYYVSAKDYESALLKAANDLQSDGYKFEGIYEGKVNQLDPTVWWDQYVMEKWAEYADHFPSQENIEVILVTGSLHKGPALGWENDASDT